MFFVDMWYIKEKKFFLPSYIGGVIKNVERSGFLGLKKNVSYDPIWVPTQKEALSFAEKYEAIEYCDKFGLTDSMVKIKKEPT